MTVHHTHAESGDDETRALDRRVAEALDLYADESGPPGLSTMAARARRRDNVLKTFSGVAAAVLVFAAGWSSSSLLSRGTNSAPQSVAELMETERDWDLDRDLVTFADLSDGAVSPVPLTEMGLVLSSTETRRARSGAIQRMQYVTRDGQPVSIVLRRKTRRADSAIDIAAYRGRDVVHWTDGPLSIGVTGAVPREALVEIAEAVRAHLTAEPARPIAPVAGGFPDVVAPSAPGDAAPAAQAVTTDTLPVAQSTTQGG
ncbi:hypothetical protein ACWCOP_11395 [Maricaulaceae bacterium MS644]